MGTDSERRKKVRKQIFMTRLLFGVIVVLLAALVIGGAVMLAQKIRDGRSRGSQSPGITESSDVLASQEMPETMSVATEVSEAAPLETQTEEPETSVPVWTTDLVNLRAEATTESEALAKIPARSRLVRLGEKSDFSKVSYDGKEGFVATKYLSEEEPKTNGKVVCIDPGHQRKGDSAKEPNGPNSSVMKARVTGGTSGATSGLAEYELVLQVSEQLKTELEGRGYTVYMTRTSHDVNISNKERAEYATSVGADLTIRIHANGADSTSASGACVLVPSKSNPYVSNLASKSYELGSAVLKSYCAATGMASDGVITSDTMTGINWSTMPVAILEMGYMTNPTDDANMASPSYQASMVKGIADGIDSYSGN